MEEIVGAAKRKLHIIVMSDTSGSMAGSKIESLNTAMEEVIPALKEASAENSQAEVFFRMIDFSTGAEWFPSNVAEPVANVRSWVPREASGVTDMGAALRLLTNELTLENLGPGNYPPVLILLSDGVPTDDWESALREFNNSVYGSKPSRTVRVALAVGGDADEDALKAFTGNSELVFKVTNPTQFVKTIKWATVTLSKVTTEGQSTVDAGTTAAEEAKIVDSHHVDMDDGTVFADDGDWL